MQTNKEFTPTKDQIFGGPKSFRLLLSAQSGSGKSQLINEMMTNQEFGLSGIKFDLDKIYIICPTLDFDQAYHEIIQYLETLKQYDKDGELIVFDREKQVFDKDPEQALINIYNNIFKQQGDNKKAQLTAKYKKLHMEDDDTTEEFRESLVILDDIIQEIKLDTHSNLAKILTKCRHIGLSMIISIQNLKSLAPICRNQLTHIISFSQSQKHEAIKLQEETSGTLGKQFNNILSFVYSQPYNYLLVILSFPQQYRFFKGNGSKIQQIEL